MLQKEDDENWFDGNLLTTQTSRRVLLSVGKMSTVLSEVYKVCAERNARQFLDYSQKVKDHLVFSFPKLQKAVEKTLENLARTPRPIRRRVAIMDRMNAHMVLANYHFDQMSRIISDIYAWTEFLQTPTTHSDDTAGEVINHLSVMCGSIQKNCNTRMSRRPNTYTEIRKVNAFLVKNKMGPQRPFIEDLHSDYMIPCIRRDLSDLIREIISITDTFIKERSWIEEAIKKSMDLFDTEGIVAPRSSSMCL